MITKRLFNIESFISTTAFRLVLVGGLLFLFSNVEITAQTSRKNNSKNHRITTYVPKAKKNAKELLEEYRFEEAIILLQQELRTATNKHQSTNEIQLLLNKAMLGNQMLERTAQVVFVDSIIVPYNQLLSAYKYGRGIGNIVWGGSSYPGDSKSTVFLPPLNDRVYFATNMGEKKNTNIASSYRLGEKWDKAMVLSGLQSETESQKYPFMLNDGITLYYASESPEELGGMDIHVTQYNDSEGKFVRSENIGMPFNSPKNDFLYVIDEENQLGWFATDRNQQHDSVCVYTFIPPTIRKIYDSSNTTKEQIRNFAKITCISDTWKGHEKEVEEAKKRLKQISASKKEENKTEKFLFLVNDDIRYTQLSDVTNSTAKKEIQKWLVLCSDIKQEEATLLKLREEYSKDTSKKKSELSSDILTREEKLRQDIQKRELLEESIRNIIISK